eukprot:scaffold1036_cov343-Prasinococcus_capsulatus_cf.AAC.3
MSRPCRRRESDGGGRRRGARVLLGANAGTAARTTAGMQRERTRCPQGLRQGGECFCVRFDT